VIRDRLQNHTLQDVSSKSYDRWNYMPEKRAAMKKWNAFARALLSKKRPKSAPALRYDTRRSGLTMSKSRQGRASSSRGADRPSKTLP